MGATSGMHFASSRQLLPGAGNTGADVTNIIVPAPVLEWTPPKPRTTSCHRPTSTTTSFSTNTPVHRILLLVVVVVEADVQSQPHCANNDGAEAFRRESRFI